MGIGAFAPDNTEGGLTMANKIRVKLILELRSAGMSRNLIASTRHISRSSVSDVFHIADAKGITYADIENQSDQDVYRMFYPDKHAVADMYRDPDYEYIHKELKKVGVTLKLLWSEYRDTCEQNTILWVTKFCEGYRTIQSQQIYQSPRTQAGYRYRGWICLSRCPMWTRYR